LDSVQTEARQLRGEKEVLKASEARAIAENQGLIQQRNMANEHMKSLQKMFDDTDRQAKESAAKAEDKALRLEKDLYVNCYFYKKKKEKKSTLTLVCTIGRWSDSNCQMRWMRRAPSHLAVKRRVKILKLKLNAWCVQ
jgi:hypothetical protein